MIFITELLRLRPTQHVTRTLKLTQSVLRTHHLVHPTTLMKQQTKINTRVLMVIAIRITMQVSKRNQLTKFLCPSEIIHSILNLIQFGLKGVFSLLNFLQSVKKNSFQDFEEICLLITEKSRDFCRNYTVASKIRGRFLKLFGHLRMNEL